MLTMFFRYLTNGTYNAVLEGFKRAVDEIADGDESTDLATLRTRLGAAVPQAALPPAAVEPEPVKRQRGKLG